MKWAFLGFQAVPANGNPSPMEGSRLFWEKHLVMSDVYLWDTYDKLGAEALERGDLEQAEEAFRSAVTLAEELGGQDARLTISLRNLAKVTVAQGELGRAHELLRQTLDLATNTLGEEHAETLMVSAHLAAVARELGYLDESFGHYKRALTGARASGDAGDIERFIEALAQLAQEKGDPDSAVTYYEQLVQSRRQSRGDEHMETAQALLQLSAALTQNQRSEEAAEPLGNALKIMESVFADDPEGLAQSLLAGAEMLSRNGQLESAFEQQKRALDILAETLEPEHEKIWEARELIATSLAGMGKLDESIELLEFCLSNRVETSDHRAGGLLKNLAGLYLATDRPQKAEELYNRAADILSRTLGRDHPAYLATQEERIQLYHFSGRSGEALKLATDIIRGTELRYGGGHPNTAQAYASTALLAHAAQEWETALELMKAAERVWQNLTPVPGDVLANCRVNQTTCLLELGRHDEARALLDSLGDVSGKLEEVVVALRSRLGEASGDDEQEFSDLFDFPEDGEPDELEFQEAHTPIAPLRLDHEIEPALEVPTTNLKAKAQLEIEAPTARLKPETERPHEPALDVPTSRLNLEDMSSEIDDEPETLDLEKQVQEADEEYIVPEIHFDPPEDEIPRIGKFDDFDEEEESELRIERRRNVNLNQFFDLRLVDPDTRELTTVRSFLVDISMGGLRVNSEAPLPLDRTFIVTIPPEILGKALELEAQVVWQRQLFGASYLQGLQFYAPTLEQSELLADHLEEGEAEVGGRQHFRLYRPLRILVRHETDGPWESCYASDISVDGLGAKLPERLDKGDKIHIRIMLEFELPTVEVRAVVAWSREAEAGVAHGLRFDRLGPVEAKTIKLYINRCLELSPE